MCAIPKIYTFFKQINNDVTKSQRKINNYTPKYSGFDYFR